MNQVPSQNLKQCLRCRLYNTSNESFVIVFFHIDLVIFVRLIIIKSIIHKNEWKSSSMGVKIILLEKMKLILMT